MTVRRRDPEISNIYSSWNVSKQLRRIKQKAIEYKGGKCLSCGYFKCNTSLVFHHRNPDEKEFEIGSKLAKWETIKQELDKCDLLCLNCHGEVHEIEYQKKLEEKEKFIRSKIPARKFDGIKSFVCKYCKSPFNGYNNRQYCSVECKSKSSRKIPSSNELQNLVDSKPIKDIAVELGVTTRAIQKACSKLNIKKSQ